MKMEVIYIELETIRQNNDGVLNPHDVVEYARPDNSLLHTHFEWDDEKASEQYRLWQARQLISLVVTTVAPETKEYEVRTYISLTSDRKEGGYRLITDVLDNTETRAQMMKDAISELRVFRIKYGKLTELAKIFAAMEEVEKET